MNIALVTAGGRGKRMKQEVPKQFMPIKNKPLIIYTLEVFQNHPNIDAILVSCLNGWEPIMEAYIKQYNITKVKWIVKSMDTPQSSIKVALKELEKRSSTGIEVDLYGLLYKLEYKNIVQKKMLF